MGSCVLGTSLNRRAGRPAIAGETPALLARLNDMRALAAVLILFAGHRNPFQFVEPPKQKLVIIKHETPAAVIATPVVKQPERQIVKEPEAPVFPYRCIGRFGPDANPFAVFDAGGAIINVRIGEVIDDKFVVRAIGFETVTIGVSGFSTEQRIAIGAPR